MIHNRDWTPINQSIHFTLAKVDSLLRLFVEFTSFCSIYQLSPQLSSVPMLESGILTSPRNLSMPLLPQSHAHSQREYRAMSEFSRWNYKLVREKPEKEHYYPNLGICYGALLIRVWPQLCVKKEYENKKKKLKKTFISAKNSYQQLHNCHNGGFRRYQLSKRFKDFKESFDFVQ